ncbi:iron uptake transporter deferrochelatase/peroxidase subunit [Rothia mucilaginosa]|uniref:Deferrochelatase n=1 Tax=Rothia mucilaginosa TaxID=43675 RepID=A0A943TAX3_9MICC|nr:iron uptake transporter deferrochelatase/peroxidase subunit [Rothia mucilaginosa]MBS6635444.1 deferrochelatase/peroxidase EfeB [Rothia mucilaginosa]
MPTDRNSHTTETTPEAHHETSRTAGTTRRGALGVALASAGALGALGALAGCASPASNNHNQASASNSASGASNDSHPFYGEHQSGISTEVQDRMYFVALNLKTTDREEIRSLFQEWTKASAKMQAGEVVGEERSYEAPPKDTGEAMDLSAAHLTITFGLGRSFFVDENDKDRFGFASKLPEALVRIPHMTGDALEAERSDGDLCIQACADDPQVAFHAIRNLIRIAGGRAVVAWQQLGFGRTASTTTTQVTARNLFGFKDGTNNLKVEDPDLLKKHVWTSSQNSANSPAWMEGGSYLAARRIRMKIETWDRTRLREQEEIVGRTKTTGAPLSGGDEFTKLDFSAMGRSGPLIPADSHVRLMHPDQNQGVQILRRGFNYTDGADELGRLDAGLFFIAYVCDPRTHFIPMLSKMTASDAMSEYLRHTGNALFAVPPGVKDENDYICSGLFS